MAAGINLVAAETAVYDRLESDSGLTALVNRANALIDPADQGIFNTNAPQVTEGGSAPGYPYVVFVVSVEEYEALFDNSDTVQMQALFWVIDRRDRESSRADCLAIIDRLLGDATDSDAAPSFGFHRHRLSVSGDWTGSHMLQLAPEARHTLDHFVYAVPFTFYLSRTP